MKLIPTLASAILALSLSACAAFSEAPAEDIRLLPEDARPSSSGSARRAARADHWQTDSDGTRHWVEDGAYAVGMREIDGSLYLFDARGSLLTGWQRVEGLWYHLASADAPLPGAATRGWLNLDGAWYHFDDETAAMSTGWTAIDGAWYHFTDSGAMDSGWLTIDGTRYYMDAGKMVSGWRQDGDDWYYLSTEDGSMTVGWAYVGGSWYYFDEDGKMLRDAWVDGCYLLDTGAMAFDWQRIDGKWYYFDANGVRLHDRWIGDYYLGSDGAMLTNTRTPDGYRVGADGAWVTTGEGSDVGDPGAERVTVSASSSQVTTASASNRKVYFEPEGTTYHYDVACRVLYGALAVSDSTQAHALAAGLEPCPVCAH